MTLRVGGDEEWSSVWTPLLQAAVRGSSEYQYRLGIKHFIDWLVLEQRDPLRTIREIDDALCEYGWWVYENWAGHGKWRLNMALYGVEHFLPGTEKRLHLARRSLRGWNNLRPPLSHAPLNWALTCLIAAELSQMNHPGAGIAVLLGFDCYLRISEIGNMRRGDVVDLLAEGQPTREASQGGSTTLLSIPLTKTWENQSVQVRRRVVAGLLDSWIRYVDGVTGGDRNAKLFPAPGEFRRLFYEAQRRLGWEQDDGSVPYVPHSMRHGGASCDYLMYGSGKLEEILFRGRWGTLKSTRHYIQQGPALMVAATTRIPRWQRELGNFMAAAIRLYINIPDEI
jgi:hypothetical protein